MAEPTATVHAGRATYVKHGETVSAELTDGRVVLTVSGQNYSATGWITRSEWDQLVEAMRDE